ncbi:inorganic phosphate transporter [Halostella sp. JP-L12]|uniref:inorganic phosphate transporter n=1 Tax=Halostella TaxID=1843185 RepID=UPI000EF78397|nr:MULTISPECIES: inorganic phosphate transporter [Halostella]NHN48081.1 inorganic phosphate transporter [Halostella sp. JP-L12]
MELATVGIMLIAVVTSMFMAWTIGAGSSGSTPFAPAVGANAISVMRAGFIVGIMCLLGAVTQGGAISKAVGTDLVHGVSLSPLGTAIALMTAALLVAIGIFTGIPISTAFTATGAIIGVGLALGGVPAWTKYREILLLWILTPFVGGSVSYAAARTFQCDRYRQSLLTGALGGVTGIIIANMEFVVLGSSGESSSLAMLAGSSFPGQVLYGRVLASALVGAGLTIVLYKHVARDIQRGQRQFLLALGGLVAFSAGGSQVGLAIGPLIPLLQPRGVPLLAILFGGGVGLLIGSWTAAPRMIKALSQDYSSLGPQRAIAVLIPSFTIAQSAIFFGIPVSFNEIIVSAIVGSGYAGNRGGVGREKMVKTGFAWVASLVGAILVSYAVYAGVEAVL